MQDIMGFVKYFVQKMMHYNQNFLRFVSVITKKTF